MKIVHYLIGATLAAGLVAGAAGAEEKQSAPQAAAASKEVHGAGSWKSDGKQQRPVQRWNLDVVRGADNTIRGRISVADSPVIPAGGNVEGHINGQNVSGTISDDTGAQLATFEGTLTTSGIQGKYTDKTGEVGEWAWHGQLP